MSNRKIPLSPVEWGIFYFPFPLLPVLRSAFPILYPPILADWKCRFVPLPLFLAVYLRCYSFFFLFIFDFLYLYVFSVFFCIFSTFLFAHIKNSSYLCTENLHWRDMSLCTGGFSDILNSVY